mmetsp:Transcript_59301/g.94140  ORF Transcript_59301/g.94140 Transcript_59301/m.94140 type:complete len:478 (-) Transcript_59301:92-1525(-)
MPHACRSRSRSPRQKAPSAEAREALLAKFASFYWEPCDSPDVPPWSGLRALKIMRFREQLVMEVELAAEELEAEIVRDDCGEFRHQFPPTTKATVVRWQRFTFHEDLARMSDVLFRGPIEPHHADSIDLRLHHAWRRVRCTIADFEEYLAAIVDFRLSSVRVAMMLETVRPPDVLLSDGFYELPDARTLASLLALRCEKDDAEELLEMYRLVCQKLEGESCTWCGECLDERSAGGLFDGSSLTVPSTVPKVLVPHCGHAIHTLCFGSQLLPDRGRSDARGLCRRCGVSYAWTAIDVDPIVSAFCLLFGSYVDKRAQEMAAEGQIIKSAVISMAEICHSFSLELNGLVSPASAWMLLSKRHAFEAPPEAIEAIGEFVLDMLVPAPIEEPDEQPLSAPLPLVHPAVVGPEDRPDDIDALSDASSGLIEERRHLTEVFLPDADTCSRGSTAASDDEALPQIEEQVDEPPLPMALPPLCMS